MNTKNDALPDRIAFIADAHLKNRDRNTAQEERLVSFLRWLRGRVSHLYIVGDLFDFWFEYNTVVPNTAPRVIFELYNLVREGTCVILFAGNHDFWLGPYLAREVGLEIELGSRMVTHQGVTMFIHHGDGLYPGDHGYRIMKKMLRNNVSISLFRFLHPDFAAWIARVTSKTSRTYLAPPDFEKKNLEVFREIGDQQLLKGFQAVVYGHAHVPLVEKRPQGMLIIPGDWIVHDTYIMLENGEFTLHFWNQSPK